MTSPVLEAGAPGEHCVAALPAGGVHVALVERELAGGECSYSGPLRVFDWLPREASACIPGEHEVATESLGLRRWRLHIGSAGSRGIEACSSGAAIAPLPRYRPNSFRRRGQLFYSRVMPAACEPGRTIDVEDGFTGEFHMAKITYQIVQHDGAWAYRVDETFSETFPTHDQARKAAELAAREPAIAGIGRRDRLCASRCWFSPLAARLQACCHPIRRCRDTNVQ